MAEGQPKLGHRRHRIPLRRLGHAFWSNNRNAPLLWVLHNWMKEHIFLKAMPITQCESSVAFLILWEVVHGKPYLSGVVGLTGRLSTFTKAVKNAVAVDTKLYAWLACKMMRMQLPGGSSTGQRQRFWTLCLCGRGCANRTARCMVDGARDVIMAGCMWTC